MPASPWACGRVPLHLCDSVDFSCPESNIAGFIGCNLSFLSQIFQDLMAQGVSAPSKFCYEASISITIGCFYTFVYWGFFCPWGPPNWIPFLSEISNDALPFPIPAAGYFPQPSSLSATARCHKTLKNHGDTNNEADAGGYRFCESFCNLSWKLARVRQTLGRSLLLLRLLHYRWRQNRHGGVIISSSVWMGDQCNLWSHLETRLYRGQSELLNFVKVQRWWQSLAWWLWCNIDGTKRSA